MSDEDRGPAPHSVCHISTVHKASDDRIFYKQCRSLARRGYTVTFVVPHPVNDRIDGVTIEALPPVKSRAARVLLNSFRAFAKGMKSGAELIHFHDPELIGIGLLFKLFGRKVIYDVHELVTEQMVAKRWLPRCFRWLVKSGYRSFEWLAVACFDKIILVVDDNRFREYFFTRYRNHRDKFVFIRNFSMLEFIRSIEPEARSGRRGRLIYAGGLSRERGIREVIRALPLCKDPPELILFGEWSDEAYRLACESEPGWGHVIWRGYRKLEEVYPCMKSADMGLCILHPLPNFLTSLPVKAYEYMACGIPVVMSDFPFWRERFSPCALFVDPFQPAGICEAVEALLNDRGMLRSKGEAGQNLVASDFSWEAEEQRLVECYHTLLAEKKR